MRRLPPLNAVRAFEVAARHVSFTKAAERVHIAQPPLSQQIIALEEELGTPLFTREKRKIQLTAAGSTDDVTVLDLRFC